MSTLKLQGSQIIVKAAIDRRFSPGTDYLLVAFGPLSMGLYNSDERKSFVAALQAADAELDVASLRGKQEVAT